MSASISLTPDERNTLLDHYRCPFAEPELRLRPPPLPSRRPARPPPGPHPPAAGRRLPRAHHRRRPLLLHPDHRPLEEALREEPPRRPARPTARPPAAPRRPLGCPGRPLGHRE